MIFKFNKRVNITLTSLITVFGTVLTYVLNNNFSFGPIVAASIVGLVAAFFLKDYRTALYAGAMAGMTSSSVSQILGIMVFVGIMTGIFLYFLDSSEFKSTGGKLGTAAFFSVLIVGFVSGGILDKIYRNEGFISFNFYSWAIFLIAGAFGAVATYFISLAINRNFRLFNYGYSAHTQILSSALVGLISVLIAPFLWPKDALVGSLVLYTSTFVGMCTTKNFLRKPILFFGIGGIISAAIFILGQQYFSGFGGKVGFIAFVSVLITEYFLGRGINYIYK